MGVSTFLQYFIPNPEIWHSAVITEAMPTPKANLSSVSKHKIRRGRSYDRSSTSGKGLAEPPRREIRASTGRCNRKGGFLFHCCSAQVDVLDKTARRERRRQVQQGARGAGERRVQLSGCEDERVVVVNGRISCVSFVTSKSFSWTFAWSTQRVVCWF